MNYKMSFFLLVDTKICDDLPAACLFTYFIPDEYNVRNYTLFP